VVSTAADLARFARAVFGGELLSPAAHEAMFTFVPGTWGRLEFGMGVYRVQSPNGELIGMDGGGAGGTSTMTRLPGADVTVVALANAAGTGGLDHLRDEAFAWALAGAPAGATPPRPPAAGRGLPRTGGGLGGGPRREP
jgi:hypothetical protein